MRGRPVAEVALVPGLAVQLARGLAIEVLEVTLPDEVLGVEGPGLPRQALPGVASVLPGPRLKRGWHEAAAAQIWSTGEGWSLRTDDGAVRPVSAGDHLSLAEGALRFVGMPLGAAGRSATRRQGGVDAPLVLVSTYEGVTVHRDGDVAVSSGGIQARLDVTLSRLRGRLRGARVRTDLVGTDDAGSVKLLLYPHDRLEDRT